MKTIEALKREYKNLCHREDKLRDKRHAISDEIRALQQADWLQFVSDNIKVNRKVKYYVGGHEYGFGARTNYGILLAADANRAIIETQTGKLYEQALISDVATPRMRIGFLNKEEIEMFDKGELEDEDTQ